MDMITWPVVAAIFAGGVPFFTFLYGILKKPNENWKKPVEDLTKRVAELETDIKIHNEKIEQVNKEQENLDNRILKRMDDLDGKIDRFVEILVNYFSSTKN